MNTKNVPIILGAVTILIGSLVYYARFAEHEVDTDYRYIKYVTLDDGTQVENQIVQVGETLVVKLAYVGSINDYVEAAQKLKTNNHKLMIAGGCIQNCIYLVDVARKLNVPVCAKSIAQFRYQRPSRINISLEGKYLMDSTLEWINQHTNEVDDQSISSFVDELPGHFKICS